jgi:hypothetical protein
MAHAPPWALIISIASAAVSLAGFVWNIWSKFYARPFPCSVAWKWGLSRYRPAAETSPLFAEVLFVRTWRSAFAHLPVKYCIYSRVFSPEVSGGSIRAAPCRSGVALPGGATSNASNSESRLCLRRTVSGRMIVRTCRIEGNQRYSWIKNQRSWFVSRTRPGSLRLTIIN